MPESVIGPYQLLGKLGAGGMGEVYRALDARVGRQVAFKILPESMARETDRMRRFEQEARLAASLNHPNVMAIYDVGLDQLPPYIVSELVQMPDASPVGQQVVYLTNRRGPLELWVSSLFEHWDRRLLAPGDLTVDGEPAQFFMNPVFSADGRRIAFAAKGRSGIQIYTMFAAGGAPVRVTADRGVIENAPTWSPDGAWIAFERETANSLGLAKVQPGSGVAPVMLGPVGSHAVPEWSPTGEWIAYHDDSGLLLISPDGKRTQRLPGDGGPVTWARDGKTLYQVHVAIKAPSSWVLWNVAPRSDSKAFNIFSAAC